MKLIRITWYLLAVSLLIIQGCSFKQSILFKTEQSINAEAFSQTLTSVEGNYTIQSGDYLAMTVYTNNGEALVDPNNEFKVGTSPTTTKMNNTQGQQQNPKDIIELNYPVLRNNQPINTYLVAENGEVNLPMVGVHKLGGMTLQEANKYLAEKYTQFYKDPFISIQYLNKRVFLLGAAGDQVIALRNENMTLIEVLAMTGNFQINSKAEKIRLIRGDLSNPSVLVIDLTTIEGIKSANLKILPGDIVYVEPRRQLDSQWLGNLNLIVTTVSSLITLYLLFDTLK